MEAERPVKRLEVMRNYQIVDNWGNGKTQEQNWGQKSSSGQWSRFGQTGFQRPVRCQAVVGIQETDLD